MNYLSKFRTELERANRSNSVTLTAAENAALAFAICYTLDMFTTYPVDAHPPDERQQIHILQADMQSALNAILHPFP